MPRTNILVGKLVRETDTLGLMLDGAAVHDGVLELIFDCAVNGVTLRNISEHSPNHEYVSLRSLPLCIRWHGAQRALNSQEPCP